MQLEGKVALVSGGGTGIGAAIADRFRREGAQVVITGRRREPLEAVAAATGASIFVGDAGVAKDAAAAVRSAVEEFGGLDIVVANAGGHGLGSLLDTDDESWALAVHSNLTTAFVLSREAMPSLIERRGSIVIVSSLAGVFAGPRVVGYTTTKHALVGLTRSLARDYGPQGVRTNVVCPGWVKTPMADEQMDVIVGRDGVTREEAYLEATSEVPLRRPAEASEIASVCLFLASSESSIVNGAVLLADGGAHIVDLPTLVFDRG